MHTSTSYIKEHNGKNSESAICCHKEENPGHIIDASDIEIIDKAAITTSS